MLSIASLCLYGRGGRKGAHFDLFPPAGNAYPPVSASLFGMSWKGCLQEYDVRDDPGVGVLISLLTRGFSRLTELG